MNKSAELLKEIQALSSSSNHYVIDDKDLLIKKICKNAKDQKQCLIYLTSQLNDKVD